MRAFLKLTKSGIVWFVLLTAALGYALAIAGGKEWGGSEFALMLIGLYLVSSGSFSLNQAQEWKLDRKMNRTASRPIPAGMIRPWQGFLLGAIMVIAGEAFLFLIQPEAAWLALATVIMYNGLYTFYWKRFWSFGAVPGALPGAMPVVIGFSAAGGNIWSAEAFYLFSIMFLWQMPHFWCLAIRYKEDYARAGVPVLPTQLGTDRTIYHIGLYMFAYVGLALAAPWFVSTHIFYLLLILPMALKVILEFFKYQRAKASTGWLGFFMWVNFSMLAFLLAPVMDRWLFVWLFRS